MKAIFDLRPYFRTSQRVQKFMIMHHCALFVHNKSVTKECKTNENDFFTQVERDDGYKYILVKGVYDI